MTKSQAALLLAMSLLLLGISLFTFFNRQQQPLQNFAATIRRDCAPWDGAAFAVNIPLNDGTVIDISLWQSPDLRFAASFSFPDDTGRIGNAILIQPAGPPDALSGKVTFQRVAVGMPVEGRFSFTSERGGYFEGQFRAEWDSQVVLCG